MLSQGWRYAKSVARSVTNLRHAMAGRIAVRLSSPPLTKQSLLLSSPWRARLQSTATATPGSGARPPPEKPLPDFNSPRAAYATKSLSALLRALGVFRLAQFRPLVARADSLVRLSYSVLGQAITNSILRNTFFAHFCAGEDEKSIAPTVKELERNGIGSILDYAAESDIEDDAAPAPAQQSGKEGVQCRVYDYRDGV